MGFMCRFPNPITSSEVDHGTWDGHVWACQRFLDASGPNALDFNRALDRTNYFSLKATALYLGLSHRRVLCGNTFVHEQAEWKQFLGPLLKDLELAPMARWQQITDGLPESGQQRRR
ncbi:hypothetical protein AC579_6426 [Pseudocercospora musae]|uniref:Uncharacterized protein n=1 Tax=Pseudocercospora musae TaxID=113226 RepID=A0A139I224_9PEZI|nr:hypothetical protein AC579_6426 [Pseudocercospora musae]